MKRCKISRDRRNELLVAYLFVFPAMALWVWWWLIPTIKTFSLSFYDYNYTVTDRNTYVGLQNYIDIFHDKHFFKALKNSLIIVFTAVPLQTVISMLLALLIKPEYKGRGVFRTLFYMPYVISTIATATLFMYLFVKNKSIPTFLSFFGFDNVTWAADIRYSKILIIFMYIWQQVGFYMIIFLAGLEEIPTEITEAAMVDGATKTQMFFHVSLPMIKQIVFLVIVFGFINTFQIFDQISAISKGKALGQPAGSTSTLVTYLYTYSFKYSQVGYGSAVAVILFFIIFAFTLIQQFISNSSSGGETE